MSFEDNIDQIKQKEEETKETQDNVATQILEAVQDFFSRDEIEQKSRLLVEHTHGCMEIEADGVYLDLMGIGNDRILTAFKDKKLIYANSEDGKGRKEVIELVSGMKEEIQKTELGQRLERMAGMNNDLRVYRQ